MDSAGSVSSNLWRSSWFPKHPEHLDSSSCHLTAGCSKNSQRDLCIMWEIPNDSRVSRALYGRKSSMQLIGGLHSWRRHESVGYIRKSVLVWGPSGERWKMKNRVNSQSQWLNKTWIMRGSIFSRRCRSGIRADAWSRATYAFLSAVDRPFPKIICEGCLIAAHQDRCRSWADADCSDRE